MEPEDRHRKRMRRRGGIGVPRYITCSVYRQFPGLGNAAIRDLFVLRLLAARVKCGFRIIAWVVMPEHVHLIIVATSVEWPIARCLLAIKLPVAKRVIARWRELKAPVLARVTTPRGRARFWQAGGGFDRDIRDDDELEREVNYIHRNPVKRGLVARPIDWQWSSSRWYADIERERQIPIECNFHPIQIQQFGWYARADGSEFRPSI